MISMHHDTVHFYCSCRKVNNKVNSEGKIQTVIW